VGPFIMKLQSFFWGGVENLCSMIQVGDKLSKER